MKENKVMKLNIKNLKKLIIIFSTGLTITIILLGQIYGIAKITVTPQTILKIDNKKQIMPPKTILLKTGQHKIHAKSDGFIDLSETIVIKPGINKINLTLKTKRESFINSLPIYDNFWDISYIKSTNQFSVIIKSEPFNEIKNRASEYLLNNGVDPEKEKIIWSSVAGVGNNTGP